MIRELASAVPDIKQELCQKKLMNIDMDFEEETENKLKKALIILLAVMLVLLTAGCTDEAKERIRHYEEKYFSLATVTMPVLVTPSVVPSETPAIMPTMTVEFTYTPTP